VPDIISRKDAKALGLKRCFTSRPCKYGHVAERFLDNKSCAKCARKYQRRYDRKRDATPERKAKVRIRKLRWAKENPEKHNARCAARRAAKLQRTPAWADLEAIARIYAQARLMTIVTGWPHHVDHIIPLRGRSVCGLHVESNLQILPDDENFEKANKFEV